MDKDMKEIANRIKERRLELGLSYRKLESLTGIAASTLLRYENGDIKNLPIDKFELISNALEVDPIELMGLATSNSERKKIGKKIHQKRNELDMSLTELGSKINVSGAYINQIEKGVRDIKNNLIIPLCKALEISPSYLLGWEEHGDFDPVSTLSKKEKFKYDEFMEDAVYYFNDESVSDEDKKKLLDSLNNIFFDIILEKKKKGK